MKLKISYYNHIKENIKQRSYLAAFSFIGLFLILPVRMILSINSSKQQMDVEAFSEWSVSALPTSISGYNNLALIFFIAIFAFITALTGFSYLHSKERQDFFHSMPVKKYQWFLFSYISGALLFIVPYVIFSLSVILIGGLQHMMTLAVLKNCLLAMARGIFFYLIIYHVMILAMVLTGQNAIAFLAGLVLFGYGTALIMITQLLCDHFFSTWSFYSTAEPLQNLATILSPASLAELLIEQGFTNEVSLKLLVYVLIFLVVSFLLSIWLCKKYPGESAKQALAFPIMAPYLKVAIAVPAAIGLSFLAGTMFYYNQTTTRLLYVGTIVIVLLLSLLIEFIYTHDMGSIFKRKGSTLLALVVSLLILSVFHFDLLGYDSKIPKKDKVTSVSLISNEASNFFNNTLEASSEDPDYARTQNLDAILPLIEEGMENKNSETNMENSIYLTVKYNYKGKASKYRSYQVSIDSYLDALATLLEDEQYKKDFLVSLQFDPNEVHSLFLIDVLGEETTIQGNEETLAAILKTFQEEFASVSIDTLAYEAPIGFLNAGFKGSYNHYNFASFYIYPSFTKTISLLKELGYEITTNIDVDKIDLMIHGNYDTGVETPIEDPKMMEEYISRISSNITSGLVGVLNDSSSEYLLITFKNNSNPITYPLAPSK